MRKLLPLLALAACTDDPGPLPDNVPDWYEPVVGDPPPGLVINEVMTDNESGVQNATGRPDWVELFNSGRETVDLSDVVLRDSSGAEWRGPSGEILPGERYVVWCDEEEGADHAPFGLSGSGEFLDLTVAGRTADRVSTGDVPSDIALARFPDGKRWDITARPTPGLTNGSRGPRSTDPRDGFFQLEHIPEIRLDIDPADLPLLDGGGWGTTRTEVPASVSIDGVFFPRVGAKLKGSGSWQPVSGKAAWKIDLNEFDPEASYRGLEGLTLNNATHDATYTHEVMSYGLFRAMGIPAPRVGYAKLWLNGEFYGFYINVETYDDELMEVWYPQNPDGELYEGYGDFNRGSEAYFHYEEGPEVQDLSVITEVVDALDRPADDEGIRNLAHYVDMDEFTTYTATEAVVIHWDGYQSPNNWRFYHDPITGLIQWLPTGMDWTWDENWSQDPFYGNGRVHQYCLSNPGCRRQFDEKMIEVADVVDGLDYPTLFHDVTEWIEPEIQADYRAPHSAESRQIEREVTLNFVTNWPTACREAAIADMANLPPS